MTLRIETTGESQTERLGRLLAEHLPRGTTVALRGTLGAGKTRLVQAIASAEGVPRDEVLSPTFVLWHTYHGRGRKLHHLDAYRVRDTDEFEELGVEECFGPHCLTLVEWADRVEPCLPPERLEVDIEITGETGRAFALTARGHAEADALRAIAAAWDASAT
jgi:tRNA threonylcarbamoyladenosine biosynthesis protein TsaE